MKDFMKKYHNKKIMWNIWVLFASLVLAIWINIFIIDGTQIWNNLKTSILDSWNIEQKADIYIEVLNDKLVIKNSKQLNELENISLSIVSNPSNINIENIESEIWEITILSDNPGILSLILNWYWKTIIKDTVLLEVDPKKIEKKSENINLINTIFTDKNNSLFELSTSWITF